MIDKNKPPQYSQKIKETIEMLKQAEADYKWHFDKTGELDRQTQDILHELELKQHTYAERAKLATKLTKVRKLRREHKNIAQATQPIFEFLQSEKGKQIYNLLREVQGKSIKVEEYHALRIYIPRVTEVNQ